MELAIGDQVILAQDYQQLKETGVDAPYEMAISYREAAQINGTKITDQGMQTFSDFKGVATVIAVPRVDGTGEQFTYILDGDRNNRCDVLFDRFGNVESAVLMGTMTADHAVDISGQIKNQL
jgi:hypothetical protein